MEQKRFEESMAACAMLAMTGGFLEAYTYILKGGVFCNAQTGNFAMLAVRFAQGNYLGALYYLLPISVYAVGITLTVRGPVHVRLLEYGRARRGLCRLRWEEIYVLLQIAVLTVLAFLPDELPDACWNVPITFLCAMQYNTFQKFCGVTLATTFCTNNLRQVAIRVNKGMLTGKRHFFQEAAVYAESIALFVLGALAGAVLASRMGGISLLFCAALLLPLLAGLLREQWQIKKNNL